MDLVHVYGDLASVPDLSEDASAPGTRNDLNAVKRKLDDGSSVWGCADEHFSTVIRYHKAFSEYKRYKSAPRSEKPFTCVFIGKPGTGKSRAAFQFDRVYTVPASNGTQWMDGYDPDQHTAVVFDDFHGSVFAHVLLRILDKYPLMYPSKGGFVNFKPKVVCLTSNFHPKNWYDWNAVVADYDALWRRLDIVWEYYFPETPADQAICENNNYHCLVTSLKGDWHPQLEEFEDTGNLNAEGRKIYGVPADALPVTQVLEDQHAYYNSLLAKPGNSLANALPISSEDEE